MSHVIVINKLIFLKHEIKTITIGSLVRNLEYFFLNHGTKIIEKNKTEKTKEFQKYTGISINTTFSIVYR